MVVMKRLTLALLILPVVIINSQEAIKAVPKTTIAKTKSDKVHLSVILYLHCAVLIRKTR